MTFWEHLAELRTRLFRAAIALIVGISVTWAYREWFLAFLVRPLEGAYRTLGREMPPLHYMGPADAFSAYMQMALVGGVFVASPVILWEVWGFVAPALYKNEKRRAAPIVLFAAVSFVAGGYYGYRSVLPMVFRFCLSFSKRVHHIVIQDVLTMDRVLETTTKILLGFGLVFEMPLILMILGMIGLVDHRMLWRFSRWAILVITVVAAILTPPDVISQIMMGAPMVVMYFLSIVLVWIVGRKKKTA
jgi:sec-independent protein translocase protein TatC